MSKETVAILALGLSLIAAVFGFGVRIGALSERIDVQTKQLDQLTGEVRAINAHLIGYVQLHEGRFPLRPTQ